MLCAVLLIESAHFLAVSRCLISGLSWLTFFAHTAYESYLKRAVLYLVFSCVPYVVNGAWLAGVVLDLTALMYFLLWFTDEPDPVLNEDDNRCCVNKKINYQEWRESDAYSDTYDNTVSCCGKKMTLEAPDDAQDLAEANDHLVLALWLTDSLYHGPYSLTVPRIALSHCTTSALSHCTTDLIIPQTALLRGPHCTTDSIVPRTALYHCTTDLTDFSSLTSLRTAVGN